MLTEKDYCDYETCVVLREVGYNAPQRLLVDYFGVYDEPQYDARVHLYYAQKWLREEKKIDVFVRAGILENRVRHYYAEVFTSNDVIIIGNYGGDYDSYEEALLEGIKEAIKILKDERKWNYCKE